MSTPLISIILPTRNRLGTITRTIEHILAQTFDDWELIISDNASTEAGKVDYLHQLAATDPRIRLHVQTENIGIHANWVFCIDQCQGRYYIPVTDDDWWSEDTYLEALLAMHDGHVGCVFPDGSIHHLDTGEVTEHALTAVYSGITSRYELCERLVVDGKGMLMFGLFNLDVIPKAEIIRVLNNGLVTCIETVGMNRIAREYTVKFCPQASYHHTSYQDNFFRGFGEERQLRDRGIATFQLLNDLRLAAEQDPGYAPALAAQWSKALGYCNVLARNRSLNSEQGDRFVTKEQDAETKAIMKTLKDKIKALDKTVKRQQADTSSPLRALRTWWRQRRV